jgi:hypothetical protein
VIVQMSAEGERLGKTRIDNDPFVLAEQVAAAVEGFGRRSRLDPVKFQAARPACWVSSWSAVS